MSQKVTVNLIRSKESSITFWRILDENSNEVFSANGYLNDDSVTFSLDSEKHFSLWLTVQDTNLISFLNYTLTINGEAILRITKQSSKCEQEYNFYTGTRDVVSKIIGGTDASIVNFPWQVYYKSGNYRCGATIIAPGWILTAAHCTEDELKNPIPVADMSIVVGTEYPTISGKTYLISEVIKHENYNWGYLENDIALLKLKTPINYPNATPIKLISPIDVSEGATDPGVMSQVTGWGLVRVSPPRPSLKLQKAELPIVSNEQAFVSFPRIPPHTIMAGYLSGNQDACSGDSGGPLVVQVTGEYKLAGIVSWGSETCNTYGGYTRVLDFLDWIAEKTGIIDFRPGVPSGNNVICNSADTSFFNVESYPSAASYDWKLYPDNTGTIIGNITNAKVAWNSSFSGQVRVMVRATVNGVVSDWSKRTVLVSPKIKLLTGLKDTSLCANLPLKIMNDAEGYNLTFNWYKNTSLIQSGSSNAVSFDSLRPGDSGKYKCDISDGCGNSTSKNMNLTVQPLTAVTKLNPLYNISFGDNSTLDITSDGLNLSYQWHKDGSLIADATDPFLRLYDVNTKDIGQYTVTIKGTCGTITSDSIYVYVKSKETSGIVDVFVWPTIASADFNIAVNNDEPYTIQVYSMNGILIKELKKCRYLTNLNANTLSPGNYILNIFGNKFRKSVRVIKK